MYQFLILLVTLLGVTRFSNGEYIPEIKGMQDLTIFPETPAQHSFVKSFSNNSNIDFLKITRTVKDPIDVLVTADEVGALKKALDSQKIPYQVNIEDVEKTVNEEKVMNEMRRMEYFSRRAAVPGSVRAFTYYPRFKQIETYLRRLTEIYNNVSQLIEIGRSYQGRPIYVVKISSGGYNKPAIFIDAGIHAREWIAPTTALYALHVLLTVPANSQLYANVDWYILPSLNPDGYEFTHTGYRFWRKTRSKNANSKCTGTDPNRNFDMMWMAVGASSNPCAETYAGSGPFSEPETQALRDYLLANTNTIKVYLTLHSYGKYLLHPWGYTSALPDNEPTLRSVGVSAANAIARKYGTKYQVGSSTNVLYAASGGSDDWAKGVAGIDLTYTIELPGGKFDPPVSRIKPVGIETFEAFKVFHQYVENNYAPSQNIFYDNV